MNKPVLLFRADANSKMGTGHLMRSTSLAGILSNDFTCKLITTCTIAPLLKIAREKFAAVHVIEEGNFQTDHYEQYADENRLIVVDGYHFTKPYQAKLKSQGFTIAVIDDLITEPVSAELVVNHCGGLLPSCYKASAHTVFGLGTSFLLLNPLFLVQTAERRTVVRDKNCLVCLGGADPANDTVQVVQKLVGANEFERIHVVIGAAYQGKNALASFCANQKEIQIHEAISPDALKQLMEQCSFAVCSASTVSYEYLSVGGVVWLKQIADNQQYILQFLTGKGLALDFDRDGITTAQDFPDLLKKQAEYFDGKADTRLRKLFTGWALSSCLTISNAGEEDLLTTYQWINDPEVRNQSYSANVIPLESHTDWFLKKIKATDCFYYILLLADDPVAQIRFDISDQVATISYLTDKAIRGKGMGPWVLAKGIQQLLSEARPAKIIGHVKKNNLASLRSFEKLAFEKAESTAYPDSITFTMTVDGNYN